MPGKVKNLLPADEYQKLLAALAAISAEPTLPQIQAICGKFGIRVSGRGGATTVKKDFEEYLAELKQKKAAAEMMAAAGSSGVPAAQAGLAVATEKILARLMEEEPDDETLQNAVFALARARASENEARLLEAKIADFAAKLKTSDAQLKAYERKEQDWNREREIEVQRKAAASAVMDRLEKKGGLSKEGREALNAELYGKAGS